MTVEDETGYSRFNLKTGKETRFERKQVLKETGFSLETISGGGCTAVANPNIPT
jgi:hypothetical protein